MTCEAVVHEREGGEVAKGDLRSRAIGVGSNATVWPGKRGGGPCASEGSSTNGNPPNVVETLCLVSSRYFFIFFGLGADGILHSASLPPLV